jgi:hypothetical protein
MTAVPDLGGLVTREELDQALFEAEAAWNQQLVDLMVKAYTSAVEDQAANHRHLIEVIEVVRSLRERVKALERAMLAPLN